MESAKWPVAPCITLDFAQVHRKISPNRQPHDSDLPKITRFLPREAWGPPGDCVKSHPRFRHRTRCGVRDGCRITPGDAPDPSRLPGFVGSSPDKSCSRLAACWERRHSEHPTGGEDLRAHAPHRMLRDCPAQVRARLPGKVKRRAAS